jgi:solute carrier family 25 aspartate/glutamate transporter 12/13
MKGLQGERLRQAFRYFDRNQDGYIDKSDFRRIIYELARHKLSDSVLSKLEDLAEVFNGGKISYSECIAFHNVSRSLSRFPEVISVTYSRGVLMNVLAQVIREMDLVEKVVREACARSPDGKITPLDFTNHASRTMRYGTFSPMEVAIIFHYARQGLSPEDKPRLGIRDFGSLLDAKWGPPRVSEPGKGKSSVAGSAMHEVGKASRRGFR